MSKSILILLVSLGLFPFTGLIEKYFFSDWEFLKYLIIMIVGDTILGFLKNLKAKTLSSRAWGQIVLKLISYMSLLIVSHVFATFTISGSDVKVLDWFETLVLTSLMVKEGISIIENIGAVNESLVPGWLLKKLKEFDNTGKFKNDESF